MSKTIGDVGEKDLIRHFIRPLLNPDTAPDLPGDDCGYAWLSPDVAALISTDRVPWDLISFELGLIDVWGLGYYLAVLNISDVAAMGGIPRGLVLNLGLPSEFPVTDLIALLRGSAAACAEYGFQILGGDLSDSPAPSISATVLGVSPGGAMLHRAGASEGHRPYCTGPVGLTPTAFAYFRQAKPRGLRLPDHYETLLISQFTEPRARVQLGRELVQYSSLVTCMDNTDGIAQSLAEISEMGTVGFILDRAAVPIHDVTHVVASFLGVDALALALRPGADFQLVGSFFGEVPPHGALIPIGTAGGQAGTLYLKDEKGLVSTLPVEGWNYFRRTDGRNK